VNYRTWESLPRVSGSPLGAENHPDEDLNADDLVENFGMSLVVAPEEDDKELEGENDTPTSTSATIRDWFCGIAPLPLKRRLMGPPGVATIV